MPRFQHINQVEKFLFGLGKKIVKFFLLRSECSHSVSPIFGEISLQREQYTEEFFKIEEVFIDKLLILLKYGVVSNQPHPYSFMTIAIFQFRLIFVKICDF